MSIWTLLPPSSHYTRMWRNESDFLLEQMSTNHYPKLIGPGFNRQPFPWPPLWFASGSWWVFPSPDKGAIAYRSWTALYPGDRIAAPFDWADEMIRGWESLSERQRRRWFPLDWDRVLLLRAHPEQPTFTSCDMRNPFGIQES